jgi:hypothetical protein
LLPLAAVFGACVAAGGCAVPGAGCVEEPWGAVAGAVLAAVPEGGVPSVAGLVLAAPERAGAGAAVTGAGGVGAGAVAAGAGAAAVGAGAAVVVPAPVPAGAAGFARVPLSTALLDPVFTEPAAPAPVVVVVDVERCSVLIC